MLKNKAEVETSKKIPAPLPANTDKQRDKQGCATSFLTREKGELDKACGTKPNAKEEYVPAEAEKEAGGEG